MRFLFNQRTARVTAYLWRTLEMILSVHYTISNICETCGGYLAEFGTRLKQSFQHTLKVSRSETHSKHQKMHR